ncbi:MAG: hypothetical protein ABIS50_11545 [Luteolibacter sp.]|uniref:hypothetical protein n=1 Tax=Luteolibacter sp. TaxID=1962973 RepID=UPI003264AA3F
MWRQITEDDLRSCINSAEEAAFRTKLLAEGQNDPFAQVFQQFTGTFRDAIRSHSANKLDPDPATLPEGAITQAVILIRQRLCGRFNVGEQTETRRDEFKEASAYLKGIAKGDPLVEQPSAEEITQTPVLAPAVNESPRRDGWRNQDGI